MSRDDTTDEPQRLADAGSGRRKARRMFLQQSLTFGTAGLIAAGSRRVPAAAPDTVDPAAPPWMKVPGAPFRNYGAPSPHENAVIRWVAANAQVPGNGVSWAPLHLLGGTLTPSGLHFERHHNGVPSIDPAEHRLVIHGEVAQALEFTVEALTRYPQVTRTLFIECGGNSNSGWQEQPVQAPAGYVHGLASCSEWSGVPLSLLLDEAGVDPAASWVIAEGADALAMNISLPVAKARADSFIALWQNGERIRPENGYPLRLIVPGWEGVLHVKWLRRLQLARQPAMARNETSRYTELLPSGEALQFTFIIEAKSLITWPFLGQELPGAGLYFIGGLAWSGRGRITRVEVSLDGGTSWSEATLAEPILPCAFTRFSLPWRWDGAPCVLMSRATDETGYVQPTRARLVAERGRNGYFHYNAIVGWEVTGDGHVHHVYS